MNYRTFKLQGGGLADVPEDKIDEWMRRMDQRGVQFETADVTADLQVGEPEVIKTPRQQHGASGGWEPEPPSMADRFLETGADAVRGGLRGLTMGYGDKLEAGARSLLSGRSYADEFANQNAMHDAAAARSPYAYNTAKTLAGAPYDLGAAVLGAPGGLAGEIATGGMLGQLRGAGMSRSPTLEGTLEDANVGGAEGAAWGLGGGLAGRAIGAGSNALTSLAPKARASAMGEIGPAARAQRKLKGDEYVENLPQVADELGMTPEVPFDWRHPIDSTRQMLTFKRPGDYADQAQGLMDDVHGPAKGAAVAQATREGVSVPRQGLIDELDAQVNAQPLNLNRDPYANAMGRVQEMVPAGKRRAGAGEEPDDFAAQGFEDDLEGGDDWISDPQLTATQLDRFKQDMAAGGYKGPDEVQTVSEGVPKRAQRDASRVARGQLHSAIDEMALPETVDQFHAANTAYEQAASIANMGREKQLALNTQGPFSLPNMGRTFGAGAGGATLGAQVAGVPGAIVGGVGGILSNKAIQNYGPDVMADFLRSGPRSMHPSTPAGRYDAATGAFEALPFGAPGGSSRDAAIGGTLGGMAAGPVGAIGGAALGAMGRPGIQAAAGAGQAITSSRDRGMADADMTQRFLQSQGPTSAQDSVEQGRGYMLTDAALDALRNEPQVLGQYASQFAQAMQSNEPDAVSALIQRLSRTDPSFRTSVLPALRARTGDMQ